MPQRDGSGHALLLQKVIGKRLGGTQKIKAARGAIFGQGNSRADEEFYFG